MAFKEGDRVTICGVSTVLQQRLSDVDGGWRVSPAVESSRFWNEEYMTPETEAEELIRHLHESDAASALCNRAARMIEKLEEQISLLQKKAES